MRIRKQVSIWPMLFAAAILLSTIVCAQNSMPSSDSSGLYMRVTLPSPLKLSKLQAGETVTGTLATDVYSSDHKLFSAGTNVRFTVDHLEKRRRERTDHWPWVVNVFTPRQEKYPIFRQASIDEGSNVVTLPVSMIALNHMRDVRAHGKKAALAEEHGAVSVDPADKKKRPNVTMILEATPPNGANLAEQSGEAINATSDDVIAAGTRTSIVLLGSVSASGSRPGDIVMARLIQPVLANSHVVLPAGSVIEGKVAKQTPPRWLSRPGALYLAFTKISLPHGIQVPIAATVAGAQLDERSHTRVDPEGGLHGERPGKAWMAINIGVTAGIAKEVDDGVQLVIEAAVSTATDASTAGTARIVATCASTIYMATRRGRDVVLPRFTELDLSFDRPVSLPAEATSSSNGVASVHAGSGQ